MFGRHSIDRRGIFWRREEGREGKRAMPRGEGEAQKKGKGLRFYGRPWLLLVGVRRRSHQPHLARCCCHCCLASSFSICAIVSSTIAECCARLVNSRRALSVLLLFHLCFLLLISSPHHPPLCCEGELHTSSFETEKLIEGEIECTALSPSSIIFDITQVVLKRMCL